MKTSKRKAKPVKVKKVVLTRPAVVHVKVPPDHIPVVAVHPAQGIVEIVPVSKKKQTWWQSVFGE